MADIRATPVKYPALRFIAQALRGADQFARAPFGYTNPPLQIASDLLSVPELYRTLENVAYGSPLTRGTGQARVMTPDTKGAAVAALDVIPMAGPAARLAVRGGKAAAPYAARQALQLAERYGVAPTMNVVKPKGGNWLAGNVEDVVMQVRPAKDEEEAIKLVRQFGDRNRAIEGRSPMTREEALAVIQPLPMSTEERAIDKWLTTKLDRYIRNELATPEDPLRELAGKGISHIPEEDLLRSADWVPDEVYENRRAGGFPQEGLALREHAERGYDDAGEVPARMAAGWENIADAMVSPATVREIKNYDVDLSDLKGDKPIAELNPWMEDAAPETKVNILPYPSTTHLDLGFDSLVNELRNSLNPASGLPAELIIDPAKLEKMTVPHIVKHVSDINAWRQAQKQAELLENLKGDARFVDPNLNLSFVKQPGGKWVDIPDTADPKNLQLCQKIGGGAGWCTQEENFAESYGSGRNRLAVFLDAEGRPHVQVKFSRGFEGDEYGTFQDITEIKPPENSFNNPRSMEYTRKDPEYKNKVSRSVADFLNNSGANIKAQADLGNFDIVDTKDMKAVTRALALSENTKDAAGQLERYKGNLLSDESIPRYMPRDDFMNLFKAPDPDTPKFAEGGSVMIDDLYDKYEDSDMAALQNMSDPMYYEERGVAPGQPQDFGSNQEALDWLQSKMQDEPGVEPIIDLGSLHSIKLASDPVQVPTADQPFTKATTPLRKVAINMARKYNLPVDVFLALIKHESGFNPNAKSPVGAFGLTQLMEGTAKDLKVDRFDPVQNLEGGAKYLRQLVDKYKSLPIALAAYNAGMGRIAKYKGIPPFKATKEYVGNILKSAGLTDSFKNAFPEVFAASDAAEAARAKAQAARAAARKRPVVKKAEGGSVSKYDPAEIMMLADQIREGGYV